jgi:hypothetical protein
MSTNKFSCFVSNTDASVPLRLQVYLNKTLKHDLLPNETAQKIEIEFKDDDQCDYQLEFVMSGKLPEHTKIDDAGKIVKDAMLSITKFELDDFGVDHLVQKQAKYTHDVNQTGSLSEHRFYEHMGCNGTVVFDFTSPAYLWILEQL